MTVEDTEESGWVSFMPEFVTCDAAIVDVPVVQPVVQPAVQPSTRSNQGSQSTTDSTSTTGSVATDGSRGNAEIKPIVIKD